MGQFKDITIKEVIEEINVSYFLRRKENRATI